MADANPPAGVTPPPQADDGGDIYEPSLDIPRPSLRPLKALAYDPSRGRRLGNSMCVEVRYEETAPGPVGDRFAVGECDGAQDCYYAPVDLDHTYMLIRGGMDPSEVDPRFHQQMVY